MRKPLVSICVPTWNRAASLRAALGLACGQDYENIEILVSDNASTDDTEQVCREAMARDARIRYVRHPRNIGLYGNHNFLIDESRGEYICYFHDHDTRTLDVVSEYVRFLEAHPEVGIVSSDWTVTNEAGEVLGVRDHPVAEITPGLEFIEQTIRAGRSSMAAAGGMIRREALGPFRFDQEGPLGFGDFVVWFQIAERWSVGHIAKRLWGWAQEPNAQSVRRIVSLVNDFDVAVNTYCDGFLARAPQEGPRVARWRRLARRYIFWALSFEVGLHHRDAPSEGGGATLFEIMPYRLTPEEFDLARAQLARYQTGVDQRCARAVLEGLLRLRCTWPLAWATRHYASMRVILGLR